MGLFRGFARGAGVFSGEITKLIAESDCTTARFAELMGVDARTLARLERRSEVPAALVAAGPLIRLLGDKVEAVITRLLGVLLAALAAQYVIDGLKGSFGL